MSKLFTLVIFHILFCLNILEIFSQDVKKKIEIIVPKSLKFNIEQLLSNLSDSGITQEISILTNKDITESVRNMCHIMRESDKSFDILITTRRLFDTEVENLCNNPRVKFDKPIFLGYQSLSVISKKNAEHEFDLEGHDIYKAISTKEKDDKNLKESTWRQINQFLPDVKIKIYGPKNDSWECEVLKEFFADIYSQGNIGIDVLDANAIYINNIDGPVIVKKIENDSTAIGIISTALEYKSDKIKSNMVDGKLPNMQNLSSEKYVFSRPIYMYTNVKRLGDNNLKKLLENLSNKEFLTKNTRDAGLVFEKLEQ